MVWESSRKLLFSLRNYLQIVVELLFLELYQVDEVFNSPNFRHLLVFDLEIMHPFVPIIHLSLLHLSVWLEVELKG